MKLVLVEWEDSYGCSSRWRELDELTPEVLVCRSIGWLIHDGKECKVIAPHLVKPPDGARPSSQGMGDMTIPTRAIVRMSEVKIRA